MVKDTFLLSKRADVHTDNVVPAVTVTKDNIYETFVSLRTALRNSNAISQKGKDAAGRRPWAVVNPDIEKLILLSPEMKDRGSSLVDKTIREGTVYDFAGFDVMVDKLSIAIRTMGYKFRRQLESDYGIDAHIEIRENEQYPTGKLIGVQVKTDGSDCTEAKEHYNFTSDYTHLNYWLNHSLPVIIVHYDIEKDILNWVQVKEDKITRNKESWSIKIPKSNIINDYCKYELTKIAENIDIQTRKYNILQESLVLMENIQAGNKVCIEYQDWINKSLAIRALRINVYSNETEILESIEWPFDVFPNDLETGLAKMFPWATFENDFSEDDEDDDLKYEYMNEWGYPDERYIDWDDYIVWKEHRLAWFACS